MCGVQRLTDLLQAGAAADPTAPALIEGDRVLSHADLMVQVDALASLLQRWLGPADRSTKGRIGPRVGLCASNSIRHVVAYLAILRAGAVWVPVNPWDGAGVNRTLVRQAELDLLLMEAECADYVGAGSVSAILIDEGGELDRHLNRALGEQPVTTPEGPEDILGIRFTGIAAGSSRGVLLPARSFRSVSGRLGELYGFGREDTFLLATPLSQDIAHFILPVLAAGGRHLLLPDAGPAGILEALRQVTLTYLPPELAPLLLGEEGFGPGGFPTLRHLVSGAGPLLPAVALDSFGPRLSMLYGVPEAPLVITALPASEMADGTLRGTVGRAGGTVRVGLLGPDGGIRETDGEGEVVVAGDIVMSGYLDAPVETAAAFHDGWLRTGDLGQFDEKGYLTLKGRLPRQGGADEAGPLSLDRPCLSVGA